METFRAVVAHSSFTRAAEAMHLTQPAVTRQVAALERELKTRLFERQGRTVRLTAAGEALDRYAERVLRLAEEAREAVTDIASGAAGRLAVGASSTLAAYYLPPLLTRFRAAHPSIELTIRTGVSARVRTLVRDGAADVGIVTTGEEDAESAAAALTVTPLGPYETCLVVPPGHPLDQPGPAPAGALAGQPLLLMEPGTSLRAFADRLLATAEVRAPVTMELDSVEAIKRMVEAGLGISLLPRIAVALEAEAGRLAVRTLADSPRTGRGIALICRRDRYRSAALRAFLALLDAS